MIFQLLKKPLLLVLLAIACCFGLIAAPAMAVDAVKPESAWLLVDIDKQRLVLFDSDNHALQVFHNIAIGSGGVSELHFQGDMTTPLGRYRVTHINLDSRYHAFIGLDYPTIAHARLAYFLGKISEQDFNKLIRVPKGETPPGGTALGGMIGIHALGEADPEIHKRVNWTDGCIALENEQMDELLPHIYPGMLVVIRRGLIHNKQTQAKN